MAKRYRKCILCGQEYLYCSGCSKDITKPAWMAEFHEENCKTIFKTCVSVNMGHITKDEAKDILSQCNLENKSKFTVTVKDTIDRLFAEPEKPAVEKIEKVEPVIKEGKAAPAPIVKKAVKAPVAPKAAKTPVVEKTEAIIAPEKAETIHEVVTETEEK